MAALELHELVQATGGELLRGDPGTVLRAFDIDSRRLGPDSCFFALPGERTDGHAFLGKARGAGAAAAVIRNPPEEGAASPEALIRVDDVERALWSCGELVRRKRETLRVVAVTGSAGKTTTKELLAAGLAAGAAVHRTPGNWNNHLGVPLSLLACPDDSQIAVLELGMSAAGEIAELTRLIDPDVALVTNVRPVHLEYFDSVDEIASAKGELFALLRPDAAAVVNLDDERVVVQSMRHAGPRVTYGERSEADLRCLEIVDRFDPGAVLRFRWQGRDRELELALPGSHAALNALAALAAVVAAGGDLDAAADAMTRVQPAAGRGRLHRFGDGITLVDDSYNSSPAALASVLRTVGRTDVGGRKIVVMGEMLELGETAEALHAEAGRQAGRAGVDVLIGVGPLTRAALDAARRAGVRETHGARDAREAAREMRDFLRAGDLVVVKGSRGVRLERLVRRLLPDGGRN